MNWSKLNLRIHQIALSFVSIRFLVMLYAYFFLQEIEFYNPDKMMALALMMFLMSAFDWKKNVAKYQLVLGILFLLEHIGSKLV